MSKAFINYIGIINNLSKELKIFSKKQNTNYFNLILYYKNLFFKFFV